MNNSWQAVPTLKRTEHTNTHTENVRKCLIRHLGQALRQALQDSWPHMSSCSHNQHNPCFWIKETTINPSQDVCAAHLPHKKETERRQAEENSHCKSTQSEKQKMLWRSALWVNRRDSWCFFLSPRFSCHFLCFFTSFNLTSACHLYFFSIAFQIHSLKIALRALVHFWCGTQRDNGETALRTETLIWQWEHIRAWLDTRYSVSLTERVITDTFICRQQ